MKIALFFLAPLLFLNLSFAQSVEDVPTQENLESIIIKEIDGVKIHALASFQLTAKILSIEKYSWDKESNISPVDFALGWQEMATEEFLSKITIKQSNRFYFWHTKDPIIWSKKNMIVTKSANMHIIPADKTIKKIINKAKKENNIYLKGYLVNAIDKNRTWKTSLSRSDTGAGACELFFVTEAIILN